MLASEGIEVIKEVAVPNLAKQRGILHAICSGVRHCFAGAAPTPLGDSTLSTALLASGNIAGGRCQSYVTVSFVAPAALEPLRLVSPP